MLRLPLEIENTTTSRENAESGEGADRLGLRRSNYGEVKTTYEQVVTLPNGKWFLFPGEERISHVVMDLVNNTVSSQTPHGESIALETSPKSRSSIGATVGKFLRNFLSSRSRSSQQNEEDSENLRPNIYPKEGSSKVFPGRRAPAPFTNTF